MKLPRWVVGEFVGTFLLVFFGCGVVAAAVLLGAHADLFHVALVWGLGIALAIHLTGDLSGAHLNPAVTCALVACGRFPLRRMVPYVVLQVVAAFVAAAVVHGLFASSLRAFESTRGLVRGQPGSEASAMIHGEFFPNPGGRPLETGGQPRVSAGAAFLVETVGTAVLVLVILAVTDNRNGARPRELAPLAIGLTVTLLIALFAPLTQAGFNPARDLGPRLWSAVAGWGSWPFRANGWGWLTVYILAPLLGGQIGAWTYRLILRPAFSTPVED